MREAAVHAHVNDLKEKLAALQCNVGVLLGRHEELTRERPWHQQHVRSLSSTQCSAFASVPEIFRYGYQRCYCFNACCLNHLTGQSRNVC